MSDLSVSYYGEEVDLEQALDDIFKRIQEFHNSTHCSVRELAMMPEQDDDFLQAYELNCVIDDRIGGIVDLMRELKSICKQVLGPVPKEHKEEVAKLKADAKKRKEIEKQNAKLEKMAAIAEEKKQYIDL